MKVEARNLDIGYGPLKLFSGINLSFKSGEMVSVLGPNGIGKTTFLRTLLGLQEPLTGEVRINGENIYNIKCDRRDRIFSYVPQNTNLSFPFPVIDVVLMGRSPWIPSSSEPGKKDRRIAMETLEMLSMGHLAKKDFLKLSGGEKRLVLIAKAICCRPKFLVLDEPASGLDFLNESNVLNELKNISGHGVGVVMTLRHPNHVFYLGGKTLLMGRDNSIKEGTPYEVLSEEAIRNLFGIQGRTSFSGSTDKIRAFAMPLAGKPA